MPRQIQLGEHLECHPLEHKYKLFQERVRPTNLRFPDDWRAYFIVRGCLVCHKKVYLKYILQKGIA